MSYCDEAADRALAAAGKSPLWYMERAAQACVDALGSSNRLGCSLVLCGTGNNAGDGMAVARILTEQGIRADVCLLRPEGPFSASAERERVLATEAGVSFVSFDELKWNRYEVCVDAVFGTGLSRPPEGIYAEAIEALNRSGLYVLSVDIPSGVDGYTGSVGTVAVRASETVTMSFAKPGLYLYPGALYTGKLTVARIGIECVLPEEEPVIRAADDEDIPSLLPSRVPWGNKGTFGKVLVCGGSRGMCGAPFFSAKAAYRVGAGMVRILTPQENRPVLQTLLPEALLTGFDPSSPDTESLSAAADGVSVILIGPGLGLDYSSCLVAQTVLDAAAEGGIPVILDADALTLLARKKLTLPEELSLILTPHPGELSRLTGIPVPDLTEDLVSASLDYVRHPTRDTVLVAKDARTVITDGKRIFLNLSGSSALAKAGSGDVLAGMIAGLIATGCDRFSASVLGAFLHGRAGERLEKRFGTRGVLASEIPDAAAAILRPFA